MAQAGGVRGPGSWLLAGPLAPCVLANQTGASAQRSAHGESSADGQSVSTSPWGCPTSILLPSGPRACFQHAELPCTLQTPLGAGRVPVNPVSPASPLFQGDKVREHPERERREAAGHALLK